MNEFAQFALAPEQGAMPQKEQLGEDAQRRIEEEAAQIDLNDAAAVQGFGARAQKELASFSDIALQQMLRSDMAPLSDVMQTLSEQIKALNVREEAKGLFRRLFGGAESLSSVRARYEKSEPKINACADEMTDRRVALMRDSALLDRLYGRNESLYKEICSLIVVGEEAIRQASLRGDDPQIVARMERRVQDLRVTQMASTQMAAQIRMIQTSDRATCEKLQTALHVTIPLWKSQMAAALGLARATDSMRFGRQAERQIGRGIRKEARTLSEQRDELRQAADKEQVQETARVLLEELEEIEADIQKRQEAMKK